MAISYIKITGSEVSGSGAIIKAHNDKRKALRSVIRYLLAMIGGAKNASVGLCVAETGGTAASGTVTISSGSGSIAAVINGVTISVTWATSDTNTATLLKNAINASANALVAGIVTATSASGVVTITAVEKSKLGNAITLTATGTGATASGSGFLTGGTALTYTSYSFGA